MAQDMGGAFSAGFSIHQEFQPGIVKETNRRGPVENVFFPMPGVGRYGNQSQNFGAKILAGLGAPIKPVFYASASFPIQSIRWIYVDVFEIPGFFQAIMARKHILDLRSND